MNWNLETVYTEQDLRQNAKKAIAAMVIFESILIAVFAYGVYAQWLTTWMFTILTISCLMSVSFGVTVQKKIWTPKHDALDRLMDLNVNNDVRDKIDRYIDAVKRQGRYLSYYEVAKINTLLRMNKVD